MSQFIYSIVKNHNGEVATEVITCDFSYIKGAFLESVKENYWEYKIVKNGEFSDYRKVTLLDLSQLRPSTGFKMTCHNIEIFKNKNLDQVILKALEHIENIEKQSGDCVDHKAEYPIKIIGYSEPVSKWKLEWSLPDDESLEHKFMTYKELYDAVMTFDHEGDFCPIEIYYNPSNHDEDWNLIYEDPYDERGVSPLKKDDIYLAITQETDYVCYYDDDRNGTSEYISNTFYAYFDHPLKARKYWLDEIAKDADKEYLMENFGSWCDEYVCTFEAVSKGKVK